MAVVEHSVEIEVDARLPFEQCSQRRAGVPRLLGQPLHEPVGVVALGTSLDEREPGVDLDLDAVFDYSHYVRYVPEIIDRLQVIP